MERQFYNAKTEGAKAGLEKKIKYWEERDFQYEFGVTLGQTMNLAFGIQKDGETPSKELVMQIFLTLLEYKLDPDFVGAFAEYYDKKLHKNDIQKPLIPTVRY